MRAMPKSSSFHRLDVAAGHDEAIRERHVAMHDAFVVGGLQRRAQLQRDRSHARPRQLALAREPIVERLAREQLHHQEHDVAGDHPEVADLDDVRMPDARRRAGLLQEAAHDLRVASEPRTQHLHGARAIERDVPRRVHLGHAALADERLDEVAIEQGLADE